MPPQIENPAGLELSAEDLQVLQQIFARYKRVILIKEFTAGLSGGRVLEARPIKADGIPELPTVVKLATVSMIQQEWQAYQKHIHNRLPHVAAVTTRPTLLATAGWGGLRYPMIGSGNRDIISLRDFCQQPDLSADHLQTVLERLFQIMDNVWGFNAATPNFAMQPSYDAVLPPNLLIQQSAAPSGTNSIAISPRNLTSQPVQPGDAVVLAGFAVQKVDYVRRTITLRIPNSRADPAAFGVRVRVPEAEPMPGYRAQQIVEALAGTVIETRESRLHAEVTALAAGIDPAAPSLLLSTHIRLPNPLEALPRLLNQVRNVNIATIHGDFNLENILIEPQLGDISLIDFADARKDHVLHDLLHLETELITHILPEIIFQHQLDPVSVLVDLSWRLHQAMALPAREPGAPEHPELHKLWVMLRALRRAARRYLFDTNDPGEYYQGLALYLLGTLRYKSLSQQAAHPLPKRIAFWAAALAYQWLLHPDAHTPPPALATLLERERTLEVAGPLPNNAPATVIRRFPPGVDAHTGLLATLPANWIPPIGALPPGSRMLLEHNPRFVGRQPELKRLAAQLKHAGNDQNNPAAIAIAGLGGIGKTQLACEFTHRFGRFFTGGVFWLSCADPPAVAAEIAACGERGAMNLCANFRELPPDEQVRLVMAEWQKPIPRLLIFDNCETPELLAQWRPAGESGCRVLVTSRRADWEAVLGIPTVSLDVLRRAESVALLHEHQPDAESGLLNAIAGELGDLPLALHLAGSYLARYRHNADAGSYLAHLHQASPLRHQSLQAGLLSPTEHDPHVARTFAVSYDQLDRDDPAAELARTLLHYAACLAPGEPIPESLARLALTAPHEDAADMARAGFHLGSAIDHLITLGLVRTEANHTLWLHRLVVAFTRDRIGDELDTVRSAVERALCAEAEHLNAQWDPLPLRDWRVHLRFVTEAALPRGDAGAADLCQALAGHLYHTADYQGACTYYERALEIRQAVLGDTHPATACSLTDLGKALVFCGELERAHPYFEQALAIQLEQLGDHEDTATTLNRLGFLLQNQEQYDEARRYHEQALRMRRALLGEEHPAISDSLCNLAYVEYAQGQLDMAHTFLQQALVVLRKVRGDEHPETVYVLTHLGELLMAQDKLAEAEHTLQQALAIQERELGAEHPETALIVCYLGDVRRRFNDLVSARLYYERALSVFQSCYGAEHVRTRRLLERLAAVRDAN